MIWLLWAAVATVAVVGMAWFLFVTLTDRDDDA